MSLSVRFLRIHWWLKGLPLVGRLVPEPKSIYIRNVRRVKFPLFDIKDKREGRGALPVFKKDPQVNPPSVDMRIDFRKVLCDNSLKSSVGCGVFNKEDQP